RDITEQQRTEREIRQFAAYQRAILDNSPIGIAIITLENVILDANAAFCRAFGRDRGSVVGQSAEFLYADPAQYDDIRNRASPLIVKGEVFQDDILMRLPNGSNLWMRLVAHIVDVTQPEMGVIWAAEDITARKAMELDLTRSNQDLERFAYVASHDLRQPLRMINSYLTIIGKQI